jgi:hypothetical protein
MRRPVGALVEMPPFWDEMSKVQMRARSPRTKDVSRAAHISYNWGRGAAFREDHCSIRSGTTDNISICKHIPILEMTPR